MKIIMDAQKRTSGSVQNLNTCSDFEQPFEQGSVHFLNTCTTVPAVHGFQRAVLIGFYFGARPTAFGQVDLEQTATVPGYDGYRAEDDFIRQVHPDHAVDDACGNGTGFYKVGGMDGGVKGQHGKGGVFSKRTGGFFHFRYAEPVRCVGLGKPCLRCT